MVKMLLKGRHYHGPALLGMAKLLEVSGNIEAAIMQYQRVTKLYSQGDTLTSELQLSKAKIIQLSLMTKQERR